MASQTSLDRDIPPLIRQQLKSCPRAVEVVFAKPSTVQYGVPRIAAPVQYVLNLLPRFR